MNQRTFHRCRLGLPARLERNARQASRCGSGGETFGTTSTPPAWVADGLPSGRCAGTSTQRQRFRSPFALLRSGEEYVNLSRMNRRGRKVFVVSSVLLTASLGIACAVGSSDSAVDDEALNTRPSGSVEGEEQRGRPEERDGASDARLDGASDARSEVFSDAAVDASPRDASPDTNAPVVTVPTLGADDCSAAELTAAGSISVRPGSPASLRFSFDGARDTFKSGCLLAAGPDRIKPILPTGGTRLRVSQQASSVTGQVVLYAKATCAAEVDLACSGSAPFELSITAGTTYFLHIDTTVPQLSGASATVLLEVF